MAFYPSSLQYHRNPGLKFAKKTVKKLFTDKTILLMSSEYLASVKKIFNQYKSLGDKTIEQLDEEKLLFWQYNDQSNSIAVIIHHLWGNMLSRWTNFLTEDGEKEWRERDKEFEEPTMTKEDLIIKWDAGWDCLFSTLNSLSIEDLDKTVYIRKEPLNVIDAINRQLAHYSYHVGQIVYLGKMQLKDKWVSLSIPKKEKQTPDEDEGYPDGENLIK